MRQYTDIAVYSQDNQLKLLVEVKNKREASSQWAAKLRRNMYAHGQLPSVPYFLLALPDQFYLWTSVQKAANEVTHNLLEPEYRADSQPFLQSYFKELYSGTIVAKVTERSLELAVTAWLEKLTHHDNQSSVPEAEQWLQTSGLLDAIKGGKVSTQVLA